MSSLLTPDGSPNWEQTGKTSWSLSLDSSVLTIEVYDDLEIATLWRDGHFVKRFRGKDCVDQLNRNVLRQIRRHDG